jgi:glycosyltransferase involved in cell wall biosynthesis
MIGILHGYLLEGSGSNLWTRSIIRALCQQGELVHLICQENHPDKYDFIAKAIYYDLDGKTEVMLDREVPYVGSCILHKPQIGNTLPVYVWDQYEEFSNVVPMTRLSDQDIEEYLDRNIQVVNRLVERYNLKIMHANHAVLMSVVAQKVCLKYGIPYVIMPHGSAIEYVIKKDKRFYNFASEAFKRAQKLFVIGPEIQKRLINIFNTITDLSAKMIELNLGVDTNLFDLVERNQRRRNIQEMFSILKGKSRGKKPDQSKEMLEHINIDYKKDNIIKAIQDYSKYETKLPDHNLEEKLDKIAWEDSNTILFLGRLIESKGLHSIIAALPHILKAKPLTNLIIVGHGPQREVMEIFLSALQKGESQLLTNLIEWGTELEDSSGKSYQDIQLYFNKLSEVNQLQNYFQDAIRYINLDRIIFTGYLTHAELRFIFPCCDVAIFPSLVAEAGPLVFLEALSSGCFPLGTYFAGMAASIDSVSEYLEPDVSELMKLRSDYSHTISDIAHKVPLALDLSDKYRHVLRRIAIEKYDWQSVAEKFSIHMRDLI